MFLDVHNYCLCYTSKHDNLFKIKSNMELQMVTYTNKDFLAHLQRNNNRFIHRPRKNIIHIQNLLPHDTS